MINDSLCLTYFTQHNLFQSRPCCYKTWVFILSDGGVLLHSLYGPQLPYPFTLEAHISSFHSLATVDNAAINIGVQMALFFTPSVSLG